MRRSIVNKTVYPPHVSLEGVTQNWKLDWRLHARADQLAGQLVIRYRRAPVMQASQMQRSDVSLTSHPRLYEGQEPGSPSVGTSQIFCASQRRMGTGNNPLIQKYENQDRLKFLS